MKKFIFAVLAVLWPLAACAQSDPGFTTGQVPSAAQWNSYFDGKADYYSGSWTPAAAGSTGSGTLTYTTQVGQYIRVGNQVTVWGRLAFSGTSGSFSGNAEVTGLPFTSSNVSGLEFGGVMLGNAGALLNTPPTAIKLAANAAAFTIWDNATGSGAPNANTVFGTANLPGDFSFSLTYRIN